MAANTPTVWTASESGVRADDVLTLVGSPYSGAGSFAQRRWQLSLTNSFPAIGSNVVFDSQLRTTDNRRQGDQWVEVYGCLSLFPVGTVLYASCMDRNSVPESSSWATAVAITVESGGLTDTRWLQGY